MPIQPSGPQRASRCGLDPLLRPRSIAVVGASRTPGTVGRRVLTALVGNGFAGPVFPVNPHAGHVGSIKAHPSVGAIGEPVDLVVITVPATEVLDVVRDSAEAGARALLVITAGFSETGPEGAALQQRIVDEARAAGMRMVGPNCLGIITTAPDVSMNASFAPDMPPPGRLALCSQSGALGIAVIGLVRDLGLGLSSFVTVGNQADMSAADLVEHWGDDPATDVILLYLESFAEPRRFREVAARAGRTTPIVMVKAGRTEAGSRAASSHTAALAGVDAAVDALAIQTGLIRAPSLHAMFDIARAISCQPLPRGRRVAIVTNSGGPAILAVDALSEHGFSVTTLPDDVRSRLAARLPAAASTANPVDMLASADGSHYRATVRDLLVAGVADALVTVFTPVGLATTDEVAGAVLAGARDAQDAGAPEAPVLACIIGGEGGRELADDDLRVPAYPFPEDLALALGAAADHADWLRRTVGEPLHLDPDAAERARSLVLDGLRERGPGWLRLETCRAVLDAAGVRLAPGEVTSDAADAVRTAGELGYPVALSLASTDIVHKSDKGAVQLGLEDAEQVRRAYREIIDVARSAGASVDGVLVAPMVSGTEMLVGMQRTPDFGPMVAVGLGGTETEVLADTTFRLTPVTDVDAEAMLRELRSWRLLTGYRTTPAADTDALVDLVRRISALVDAVPEIAELDLNPVFAQPSGYAVVDVRIAARRPGEAAGARPAGWPGGRS